MRVSKAAFGDAHVPQTSASHQPSNGSITTRGKAVDDSIQQSPSSSSYDSETSEDPIQHLAFDQEVSVQDGSCSASVPRELPSAVLAEVAIEDKGFLLSQSKWNGPILDLSSIEVMFFQEEGEIEVQIFDNIMNRDIPWPQVPEEMNYEAYDLIGKLLNENPVQRLGATGAREVKQHVFFKNINWDTLAKQKATFIPSTEGAHDTSYFTSRYIWDPEVEHICATASDFDDMTETCSLSCSSGSFSNPHDEDGDEFCNLEDFSAPTPEVKYSFSNFSFKNLSQLASINYDLLVKNTKESPEASKPSVP
ncbi:hypothetical protein HHK36_027945 [Tetracentron sinense]|uniref:non-specific serine/threonine protein kinase n=1 Tax=Tetracentron sinense TaxID=13715 RepID=A0A835D4V9_TETSI|nr:hypothetical protein HHK36_027945 [Tetracentron sinense]